MAEEANGTIADFASGIETTGSHGASMTPVNGDHSHMLNGDVVNTGKADIPVH